MEYTCIYEAFPNRLITLQFVIFVAVELIVTVYSVKNWKLNKLIGKIGMILIFSLLLLVIVCMIYNFYSSRIIWDTYKDGDYHTVEGIIEDYEIGTEEDLSLPDRFTINGVNFIISDSPVTGYGYTRRHRDGGILKNGLYCRISYIPYEFENVIMNIQIGTKTGDGSMS